MPETLNDATPMHLCATCARCGETKNRANGWTPGSPEVWRCWEEPFRLPLDHIDPVTGTEWYRRPNDELVEYDSAFCRDVNTDGLCPYWEEIWFETSRREKQARMDAERDAPAPEQPLDEPPAPAPSGLRNVFRTLFSRGGADRCPKR